MHTCVHTFVRAPRDFHLAFVHLKPSYRFSMPVVLVVSFFQTILQDAHRLDTEDVAINREISFGLAL